ncbi:Nucleotidyltransferase domain protein [uncultured archaeon]|nr:Nucleotidyltransferase domain protein [uncultured archaeon]
MKDWEIALEKFLKPWRENKDVSGITVCGSYVTGNSTKHSDVDIQIILKRGCKWRERGNKIVEGILMEYFANPPEQIEGYLKSDYKKRRILEAHMLSTGKILLDKDGEIKKLKSLAGQYLKKSFEEIPGFKIEFSKYHFFDMLDNLEEVYHRNTSDFDFVYYNFLNTLFDSYCEFLAYSYITENKVLRFLTDEKDKIKYKVKDFPDKVFAGMFIKAIKEKNKKKKLDLFSKLVKHVQNKMGGFNIDGWKMRSPVEVK